jgi:hypothetical protein
MSFLMKMLIIILCVCCSLQANSIIFPKDAEISKYLKLANQRQFQCVGRVKKQSAANDSSFAKKIGISDSLIPNGTCILISDRYVLSAAHIFTQEITKDTVVRLSNNQKIKTYISLGEYQKPTALYRFVFGDKVYEADTILFHPNYMSQNPQGQWKNYDICLIKLKKPVQGIQVPKLYMGSDEVGKKATGVGWGYYGDATLRNQKIGKKLAGENMVDTIWSYRDSLKAALVCDFDSPKTIDCNATGSSNALDLEFITNGGDSGSGLFVQKNKQWYLIGLGPSGGMESEKFKKYGACYCHSFYYVRVSVLRQWITNTMKQLSIAQL